MFDLAGQKGWKRSSNMKKGGLFFACGVMHGKIYVFGDAHLGSEVYDPKTDAWSWISPSDSSKRSTRTRVDHHVPVVGEKFSLYGGVDKKFWGWDALSVDTYHAAGKDWSVIAPFGSGIVDERKRIFMAQGKFYAMTPTAIYFLGDDENEESWTQLHSFWIPDIEYFETWPVLAVDGERLAISVLLCSLKPYRVFVFHSKGFRSQNKELVSEEVIRDASYEYPPAVCSVQI
ncbi:unnamed protein product [Calypogeia fissa]